MLGELPLGSPFGISSQVAAKPPQRLLTVLPSIIPSRWIDSISEDGASKSQDIQNFLSDPFGSNARGVGHTSSGRSS
jgi:hypothetical protein